VYFWPYPVFEAVRYGEVKRDTARYAQIQLNTAGYSGSAAKWLDMNRYWDTTGYQTVRYRQYIQAEYKRVIKKIYSRGGLMRRGPCARRRARGRGFSCLCGDYALGR